MYCVEVAAELLADVEEQTVRSVHQAQWPRRESPHQDRVELQLDGGDLLKIAEEDVARGIRAGECNSQPAQQGAEDRVKAAPRPREGQPKNGVHARIHGHEAKSKHAEDGQDRENHPPKRAGKQSGLSQRRKTQQRPTQDRRQQNRGARRRQRDHVDLGLFEVAGRKFLMQGARPALAPA